MNTPNEINKKISPIILSIFSQLFPDASGRELTDTSSEQGRCYYKIIENIDHAIFTNLIELRDKHYKDNENFNMFITKK